MLVCCPFVLYPRTPDCESLFCDPFGSDPLGCCFGPAGHDDNCVTWLLTMSSIVLPLVSESCHPWCGQQAVYCVSPLICSVLACRGGHCWSLPTDAGAPLPARAFWPWSVACPLGHERWLSGIFFGHRYDMHPNVPVSLTLWIPSSSVCPALLVFSL